MSTGLCRYRGFARACLACTDLLTAGLYGDGSHPIGFCDGPEFAPHYACVTWDTIDVPAALLVFFTGARLLQGVSVFGR